MIVDTIGSLISGTINTVSNAREQVRSQNTIQLSVESDGLGDAIIEANELNSALVQLDTTRQKGIKGIAQQTATQLKANVASKAGVVQAVALSGATKAVELGSKAAAIGINALKIAAGALISVVATIAIQKFVEYLYETSHQVEIVAEKANEARNSLKELNDELQDQQSFISDNGRRYEKLSKGVDRLGKNVSLTTEEYKEYNSISNDIAEMFPDLVAGYTEEGNAILSVKTNLESLTEAYRENRKEKYQAMLAPDEEGNIGVESLVSNARNAFENQEGTWFGDQRIYTSALYNVEYANKVLEASLKGNEALYNLWMDTVKNVPQALGIDEVFKEAGIANAVELQELDDQGLANLRNNIKAIKQKYQAELDQGLGDIEYAIDIYFNTNEHYDDLDEALRSALTSYFDNIDIRKAIELSESPEAVGRYVQEQMDIFLNNEEAQNALIELFKIDPKDMPIDEAVKAYDELINTIISATGENKSDFIQRFQDQLGLADLFELDRDMDLALTKSIDKFKNHLIKKLSDLNQQSGVNLFSNYDLTNEDFQNAGWGDQISDIDNPYLSYTNEDGSQVVIVTPVLPDGTVLSPSELQSYVNKIFNGEIIDADIQLRMFEGNNSEDSANSWLDNIINTRNKYFSNTFDSLGNKVGSFFDNNIFGDEDLALWENLTRNILDADDAIRKFSESKNKLTDQEISLSFGDTITQLDQFTEKWNAIDEVYAKFKDPEQEITFDDLAGLQEELKDLDGIEDYIQAIYDSGDNAELTQQAFDNLATALIEQDGILDIVNEDNANIIATYLEENGILNANILVQNALKNKLEEVSAQKWLAQSATIDFSNATADEIQALIDEGVYAGVAEGALIRLVAEKIRANNNAIVTDGDIQNLKALAVQAGATAEAVRSALNPEEGTYGPPSREQYEQNLIDIINKYTADYGSGKVANTPVYGGGSASNKSDSGGGSDKPQEEVFDWIERRIEVINDRVEKLKNNIDTLVGYKPKNAMTDTAIDLMIEKMDILNQMYDRYMQEASSIGLGQEYIDKIQQGTIDVETIQDNETLVNQINEYQEWYDKAQDVQDTIIETQQEIKELNLSKLDNIINQFDQMLDIREQIIDSQQELIDLNDQSGAGVYVDDYLSLIEKQVNLANLNAQAFNELNAEMSKMDLQKGSEEWKEYNDQLQDYRSNMISAAQAVEDYKDTITELVYKELNDFKDEMDSINETISTMNNLIGDVNLIDDSGNLTNRGLAQVALYAQQLANAKQEAAEYDEAIQSLDEALRKGLITETEYTEMMQEYTSAQNSAVEATKEARDAILNLVKEGIQAEIDAKKELTDSTIEALQAEQDLHDYQNSISESQDNISRLERQIAALSNSTDRADIAQRLQLQQELAEAQEELYETQYDHEIEQRTDALNQEYENFEEMKQEEMDELDSNLDKQNAAIEDYLNQVKDNYADVYDVLKRYGDEYNLTATEDLTTPWISGSDAANVCSDAITEAIANINYEISNIDLSPLYELVDIFNSISEYGGGNGSSSTANFEDISGTGKWQRGQGGRWWYGEEYREDGNYNYASGGTYTIDGKQYNFDDEGYMNTEWQKINGKWYYFDANDGHMVTSTWIPGNNGEYYYLQSDGTMATNAYVPTEDKTGYYYVDDEGIWDGETISEEELRKKGNVKVAYKKGTLNAKEGTALTDEDGLGSEVIITKHGALRQLDYGDTVFNSDMVKKLWDFAVDPNKFLDGVSGSKVDLSSIKPVQSSVTFSAPLFQIEGGLSSDMVGYIDSKCEWLQKNVGKLAYKDLKNTMLGK